MSIHKKRGGGGCSLFNWVVQGAPLITTGALATFKTSSRTNIEMLRNYMFSLSAAHTRRAKPPWKEILCVLGKGRKWWCGGERLGLKRSRERRREEMKGWQEKLNRPFPEDLQHSKKGRSLFYIKANWGGSAQTFDFCQTLMQTEFCVILTYSYINKWQYN